MRLVSDNNKLMLGSIPGVIRLIQIFRKGRAHPFKLELFSFSHSNNLMLGFIPGVIRLIRFFSKDDRFKPQWIQLIRF